MVPLATGSDGGGSIRIPSALCGLSGIKTTQGRVPNGGPNPPGSGLLSVKGPMTRVISDTAFALDACVGPHPTDPFSLPMARASWYETMESARLPATVVWSPTLGFAEVDEEIAAICQAAVERLEQAGTEVRQIDEVWPEDPVSPWLAMWTTSRARTQGHYLGTAEYELIDESMRGQIEWGMAVSGVDVMRAIDAIHELSLLLNDAFEHAPVLVTPVCAGQTPYVGHNGVINGDEVLTWVGFTYGFNMTRNPAGTVNVGFTADGMPVGLQVVGRQRDDVVVLQTLAALEELYGTDHRAPIGS
jgi:Asp-tRNA(Asn)/Glu-tRNA(Gln) amidotransferase A subunit family amidase